LNLYHVEHQIYQTNAIGIQISREGKEFFISNLTSLAEKAQHHKVLSKKKGVNNVIKVTYKKPQVSMDRHLTCDK
jgi:hypothetical protein